MTDNKPPITVTIESPLRGTTGSPEESERNRTYARRCARHCLKEGLAPFASHLIYDQPGVLNDLDPEERALGIEAGLAWAVLAEKRIFFTDYGWSSGMLRAKRFYDGHALAYEERAIGRNDGETLAYPLGPLCDCGKRNARAALTCINCGANLEKEKT